MKYFNIIKETLKDSKKKSLILLGIYFIFFIFVFVFLNNASSSSSSNNYQTFKSIEDKFRDFQSYNFKITYEYLDDLVIINGTYYNGSAIYNEDDKQKYYYEDNIYNIDLDNCYLDLNSYDISKFFNRNLYTLKNYLEEISSTTYKNGLKTISYNIDADIVYDYIYSEASEYFSNINVDIFIDKENVYKIVIDFNSLNIYIKNITIEYTDIDSISQIEFNNNICLVGE